MANLFPDTRLYFRPFAESLTHPYNPGDPYSLSASLDRAPQRLTSASSFSEWAAALHWPLTDYALKPFPLAKEAALYSPFVQNSMPLEAMGATSISSRDSISQSGPEGSGSSSMEDSTSPSFVQSMPSVPTRSGAQIKVEEEYSSMPLSSMWNDVRMVAEEAGTPPPFLSKTFDIVEDPLYNYIISWGPANNSFVIWDSHAFSREVLPRFFRHNNFSSFVRQLNTYGFRKVDSNRWEYANKGFLRGKRHLLKGIHRKRSVSTSQQQPLLAAGGVFQGFGRYGSVQCETESLQSETQLLMPEIERLRQQQQSTEEEITKVSKCLQSAEKNQQQMMTFLAKALHNPSVMAHLLQKDQQAKCLDCTRKRRLPSVSSSSVQNGSAPLSKRLENGQLLNSRERQEGGRLLDNSKRLEGGQLFSKSGIPTSVNEELQAMSQGMKPNQYIRESDGEVIVTLKYDDDRGN